MNNGGSELNSSQMQKQELYGRLHLLNNGFYHHRLSIINFNREKINYGQVAMQNTALPATTKAQESNAATIIF